MNSELMMLELKRKELIQEYDSICHDIYIKNYCCRIRELNVKINELQNKFVKETCKRYGEDE